MPEDERRISPALAIIPIGLGLAAVVGLAAMAWAAPPKVYTCPYCGAEFATEEELLAHIELEHPEMLAEFTYLAMTPENLLAVGDPLPGLRYFITYDLRDPFFNDGWAWGADIAVKEYPCVAHCIIQNVGGEAGSFNLILEEKVGPLDWRECILDYSGPITATLHPGEARLFSIWRHNYVGISQVVRFSAPWGYTSALTVPDTTEPEG